jgi:hypothetical protein
MLKEMMLYDEALIACEKGLIQNPDNLFISSLKKTILSKMNRSDISYSKQDNDAAVLAAKEREAKLRAEQQVELEKKKKRRTIFWIAIAVFAFFLFLSVINTHNEDNPRSSFKDYNFSLYSFSVPTIEIIPAPSLPTFSLPPFTRLPSISLDFPEDYDD